MNKIPTLFKRENNVVVPEINLQAEWITQTNSSPYRKWDGTCINFDGIHWRFRREVKPGQSAPPEFVLCEKDFVTGKQFGWSDNSSFEKFLLEALKNGPYENILYGINVNFIPGTYELMGPKINGNPENLDKHYLMRHAASPLLGDLTLIDFTDIVKAYNTIWNFFRVFDGEGAVWYGPDGQRAKLKRKDFPRESKASYQGLRPL